MNDKGLLIRDSARSSERLLAAWMTNALNISPDRMSAARLPNQRNRPAPGPTRRGKSRCSPPPRKPATDRPRSLSREKRSSPSKKPWLPAHRFVPRSTRARESEIAANDEDFRFTRIHERRHDWDRRRVWTCSALDNAEHLFPAVAKDAAGRRRASRKDINTIHKAQDEFLRKFSWKCRFTRMPIDDGESSLFLRETRVVSDAVEKRIWSDSI